MGKVEANVWGNETRGRDVITGSNLEPGTTAGEDWLGWDRMMVADWCNVPKANVSRSGSRSAGSASGCGSSTASLVSAGYHVD